MKSARDDYIDTHRLRFQRTEEIMRATGAVYDTHILEIGSRGPFTEYLVKTGYTNIESTDWDLRYAWPNTVNNKYDLVLCNEVIEHIKDQERGERDCFDGSGIKCLLQEIHARMRPDSKMILSTPNMLSYKVVVNWLRGYHPFTYQPHPRELSADELRKFLSPLFEFKLRYERVWQGHGVGTELEKLLKSFVVRNGYSTSHRDKDCVFAICRPRYQK